MLTLKRKLTIEDHGCDIASMHYVYPVVSRRAKGVSIGVNLNPNRACNWRCVYCQVEGLVRGAGPDIDVALLERELSAMLGEVLEGDFMERQVPEGARRLNDVAFAGDGEPTTSPQFEACIDVVGRVIERAGVLGKIKVVLITNGSMVRRASVQRGLEALSRLNGEVWFKVDTATEAGFSRVNGTEGDPALHLERLREASLLCPTWVQTCMFKLDGAPPDEGELSAYLEALRSAVQSGARLKGVLLYSIARPPRQDSPERLSPLEPAFLEALAARIEAQGLTVQVSP